LLLAVRRFAVLGLLLRGWRLQVRRPLTEGIFSAGAFWSGLRATLKQLSSRSPQRIMPGSAGRGYQRLASTSADPVLWSALVRLFGDWGPFPWCSGLITGRGWADRLARNRLWIRVWRPSWPAVSYAGQCG